VKKGWLILTVLLGVTALTLGVSALMLEFPIRPTLAQQSAKGDTGSGLLAPAQTYAVMDDDVECEMPTVHVKLSGGSALSPNGAFLASPSGGSVEYLRCGVRPAGQTLKEIELNTKTIYPECVKLSLVEWPHGLPDKSTMLSDLGCIRTKEFGDIALLVAVIPGGQSAGLKFIKDTDKRKLLNFLRR
jgi:hypothetical protein